MLQHVIDGVGADHVELGLDYVFDQAVFSQNVIRNPRLYPISVTGGIGMVEPESIETIAERLKRPNLVDDEIREVLGRIGCEAPLACGIRLFDCKRGKGIQ